MLESKSEKRGIERLKSEDQKIYSVGISTAGKAEVRMALLDPKRHIIATTLDLEGAKYAKSLIEKKGVSSQIEVKIEDVSKKLSYVNDYFNFIYARLVLHYLTKQDLDNALLELYRVLKPTGRMFIVVRSINCPEVKEEGSIFDPETNLTSVFKNGKKTSRYFHSEKTITNHLISRGFSVESICSYNEQLCDDFERLKPSDHTDSLIEVLVSK